MPTRAAALPPSDPVAGSVATDEAAVVAVTGATVVLVGWSGGGSLSLFYQAQAENPTITHTPAGDEVNLIEAGLKPADGVIFIAAHLSRAETLTEWLDPSVTDELDPDRRAGAESSPRATPRGAGCALRGAGAPRGSRGRSRRTQSAPRAPRLRRPRQCRLQPLARRTPGSCSASAPRS